MSDLKIWGANIPVNTTLGILLILAIVLVISIIIIGIAYNFFKNLKQS